MLSGVWKRQQMDMKVKVFIAVDPCRPFFHFKCLKKKGVSIDDKNAAVTFRQHGNTFIQITFKTRAGKGKVYRCRRIPVSGVKENSNPFHETCHGKSYQIYIIPGLWRECIGAGLIDLVIQSGFGL